MGASVAAACGDSQAQGPSSPATTPAHALIAAFPQGSAHIPAGVPMRLPYLISDREGVPLSRIDGRVAFEVARDGKVLGGSEVAPRGDGVPRAYLPFTFDFPAPGIYDIGATYRGARIESTVQVVEPSRVTTPVVGQALPGVGSPTVANPLGVDPLCSRDPVCPFHSIDLQSVVGRGHPIVLLVATPAYCQTAVCGPVLDLVVEQAAGREDLRVIHSEVYRDPKAHRDLSTATLAPVPAAYHLDFEPVLFITDRTGTVVARADVTVDRSELRELLTLAT